MAPRRPLLARTFSAAGLAGLLVLSVAACTPTRSVAAYCSTVQQHKQRYLAAMNNASSAGSLTGLLEAGSAIGDLKSMWDDLAKVAPADIQTDSETVRDAWDKANDDAGDRNFFGAAVVALSSAAAMERVNDYIAKNCGVDAAPVVATASPTPSAASTAPSATTAFLPLTTDTSNSLYDYGPQAILVGTGGSDGTSSQFSGVSQTPKGLIDTTGTVSAFGKQATVTQVAYGAQQDPAADPGFVAVTTSHEAASGLTPETWKTYIQHFASGSQDSSTFTFSGCTEQLCRLKFVTLIGTTAVIEYAVGSSPDEAAGIDLASDRVIWHEDASAVSWDGPTIVFAKGNGDPSGATSIYALNAETGASLWQYSDPSGRRPTGWGLGLGGRYAVIYSGLVGGGAAADAQHANVVDLDTGRTIASRYAENGEYSGAFDPVTNRIVLANTGPNAGQSGSALRGDLEVLSATGSTVYSISDDRYSQLGQPTVLGALDGRVWIQSASGPDIFDEQTGQQDPDSPATSGASTTRAPRAVVGSSAVVTTVNGSSSGLSGLLLAPTDVPTRQQIAASAN